MVSRVDITSGTLNELDLGSMTERRLSLGGPLGFALPATDERYVAGRGLDLLLVRSDGQTTLMCRIDRSRPATRINDAACDPIGRLWLGTMSIAKRPREGALYRLEPDGSLTTFLHGVTTSNGIAWSPDGRSMYYVDTAERRIDVFDYDVDRGWPSARRQFVEIHPDQGKPDGLAVDIDGQVWVALYGGAAVECYRANGSRSCRVEVPAANPTSVAFAGDDLRQLFVTSARSATHHEGGGTAPDLGGGLFRMTVDRPGLLATPFAVFP